MRVAIVFHRLLPDGGGAERWTSSYINWLAQRHREVLLVCSECTDAVPRNVERIVLPDLDRFEFSHRAARLIADLPVDIVHDMGYSYGGQLFHPHCGSQIALANAKAGCYRGLRRFTHQWQQRFGWRSLQIARLVEQQYKSLSTHYLAVSHKVAREIQSLHHIPKDRITVVHNGVDLENFNPKSRRAMRLEARRQLGIGKYDFTILTVAHNHRLKGVSKLQELLRLPDTKDQSLHLVVVGGHRQRPQRSDLNGNRVSYLGARDDVVTCYAAADVFALATYYDACSITVLEALACGLPVITTECNGASEVLTPELKDLVCQNPSDLQQIWSAVRRCRPPEFRNQMETTARQIAERHSLESNYLAIETLYDRLARRRVAA